MTSAGTDFGLKAIGQIAVNVHDLKRAVDFYRDVLGMRLLFQVPNLAFFDCSGIRLMLGPAEKPEFDHPGSILYYRVSDIQEAFKTLKARGARFEGDPHPVARLETHDLWLAFLKDSEGNFLALMSEVPR